MEKICLVKAGNYFLAIDTAVIRSTVHVADADPDIVAVIHMASFFSQQELPVTGKELLVFDDVNGKELPAFLVDSIVKTIAVPERFESMPLLFPSLAKRCCPHIFLYENLPVMLMDHQGFCDVFFELKASKQSIPIDELPSLLIEQKEQFESSNASTLVSEVDEAPDHADVMSVENSPGGADSEKDQLSSGYVDSESEASIAQKSLDESCRDSLTKGTEAVAAESSENESVVAATDEPTVDTGGQSKPKVDPLDRLVFWIIGQYLEEKGGNDAEIIFRDIPLQYLRGLSMNDKELLYLITKTLRKCKSTNKQTLRQLVESREK